MLMMNPIVSIIHGFLSHFDSLGPVWCTLARPLGSARWAAPSAQALQPAAQPDHGHGSHQRFVYFSVSAKVRLDNSDSPTVPISWVHQWLLSTIVIHVIANRLHQTAWAKLERSRLIFEARVHHKPMLHQLFGCTVQSLRIETNA